MPIANSGIHMIKANNLCSHITIKKKIKSWTSVQKSKKMETIHAVFFKKKI